MKSNRHLIRTVACCTAALAGLSQSAFAITCGEMEMQAHRGSYRMPENTTEAIVAAFQDGFQTAEIDVQRLKTGQWVIHHDMLTGRAVKTKSTLPAAMLTESNWRDAKVIDRHNTLTSTGPSFLNEAISASNQYLKDGQRINIEIKGVYPCPVIRKLHESVNANAPKGSWIFSSVDTEALQCLRQIDPQSYLGVVVAPEPDKSIDRLRAKIGEKAFKMIKRYIETKGDPESIYDSNGNRDLVNDEKLTTLAGFGNAGLHIDAETLSKKPAIMQSARTAGVKVFTYFDGNDDSHIALMQKIKNATGVKPDGMILNGEPQRACSMIKQAGLVK